MQELGDRYYRYTSIVQARMAGAYLHVMYACMRGGLVPICMYAYMCVGCGLVPICMYAYACMEGWCLFSCMHMRAFFLCFCFFLVPVYDRGRYEIYS